MSEENNHPDVAVVAGPAFRMVGSMGPLFAALAEATAKFLPIQKDRHVKIQTRDRGTYEFDYATLEEVLRCTTPALAASGLKLWHFLCDGTDGDREIHHILSHASGAFLETVQTLPRTDRWQEFGSAITYARRYQVQCILGVSAEFDDDGNEADGNKVEAVKDRSKAPTPKAAPKPAPAKEPELRTQPKSDRPPPQTLAEYANPDGPDEADVPCPKAVSQEIGEVFRRLGMHRTETVVMCKEVTGKAPAEMTLRDGEMLLAHVKKLEAAERQAKAEMPGNAG